MNKLTWFAKTLLLLFLIIIILTCYWLYKSLFIIKDDKFLFDTNKKQILTFKCINFYNYLKYKITVYNKQEIVNKSFMFQDIQGKKYETNIVIIYKNNPYKDFDNLFKYEIDQFLLSYFSKISSKDIFKDRDIHKEKIKEFLIKKQLEVQHIYLNGLINKQ